MDAHCLGNTKCEVRLDRRGITCAGFRVVVIFELPICIETRTLSVDLPHAAVQDIFVVD